MVQGLLKTLNLLPVFLKWKPHALADPVGGVAYAHPPPPGKLVINNKW